MFEDGFELVLRDVRDVATIAGVMVGAVGLLFTAWQLARQARLARSAFEDGFAKEYRAVIKTIPTKALLGRKLTHEERVRTLDDFYHYIDLCNEQAYLNKTRRISRSTWKEWRDGITGNLSKPEFKRAWSYIAYFAKTPETGTPEFESLREVVPPDPYDEGNPYIQGGAP